MKQLLLMTFTLMIFTDFVGLATVSIQDAEARRLGGGRSFGRSAPSRPPQRAMPQRQQQSSQQLNRNPANPRPSGASRWLGPLAGLAAGGLLASLLFGDAFQGFSFMDFLLLAALIFGAVMLFRSLRAKSAVPGPRPAHAPAGPPGPAPRPRGGRPNFEIPEIGSGRSSSHDPDVQQLPDWFDEERFLQAAKTHFVELQAAWDAGDMQKIREYVTPELYTELSSERQSYGGERQFTEVVKLDVELLGLVTEGNQVVASVRYSGMIREDLEGAAHPFREIWHIERALNDSKANWYVAGIEQEN